MRSLSQVTVSIIVPCYNLENFVKETLESVYHQIYNYREIIVVSDGSFDNSDIEITSYSLYDKNTIVVHQANCGVSTTRNNGIAISCGKYILPLDADDTIASTYVMKAVDILEKGDNVKMVYCKGTLFGAASGSMNLPDYNYEELLWHNMIFDSAVFRKRDFDKSPGYRQNMKNGWEDWDFYLSFINEEDIVIRINEELFNYRIRKNSRERSLYNKKHELYVQIYENNKDKYCKFDKELIAYHNGNDVRIDNAILEVTNQFLKSTTYRVGYYILFPFMKINSFIRGIINNYSVFIKKLEK